MPEPITVTAALTAALKYGPAALKLAGSLKDLFSSDPGENFKQQILDSGIMRHAQGQFTGAERDMMLRQAAPQLNQAFSTVAAAGLANTGAGASVIAQQQQNVFHRAQDRAFQTVHGTDFLAKRYQFARNASPNFLSQLGTIASSAMKHYQGIKERGQLSEDAKESIQGLVFRGPQADDAFAKAVEQADSIGTGSLGDIFQQYWGK